MAGAKSGNFKELISPFLKAKMEEEAQQNGKDSAGYLALERQYVWDPLENYVTKQERRRHYESEVTLEYEGREVIGVERLYRRTILIEPTTVCAAHCRWCLRGQYPVKTMSKDDIVHASRYIGSEDLCGDIREVLITGGDPLMSLPLLKFTIENLVENAPNVRIIRIGSRVPFHDPARINEQMCEMFSQYSDLKFEIGVNVNHAVEFWPESVASIKRLQDVGVRFYNQHPLLKGVNDDLDSLIDLYSHLRDCDIDAHYMFHAIPMRGMSHHRTSVAKGLELASRLSSCGEFSGRSKPRYAVLSDIGKIVLYHDTIVDHRNSDNALLLKSGFKAEDRMKWNPSWRMPDSALVDNSGYLMTWYVDGNDTSIQDLNALAAM